MYVVVVPGLVIRSMHYKIYLSPQIPLKTPNPTDSIKSGDGVISQKTSLLKVARLCRHFQSQVEGGPVSVLIHLPQRLGWYQLKIFYKISDKDSPP